MKTLRKFENPPDLYEIPIIDSADGFKSLGANFFKTIFSTHWFLSLFEFRWTNGAHAAPEIRRVAVVAHGACGRPTCEGNPCSYGQFSDVGSPSCCLCGNYGGAKVSRTETEESQPLQVASSQESSVRSYHKTRESQTVTSSQCQTRCKCRNRKNQTRTDDPTGLGGPEAECCDKYKAIVMELQAKIDALEETVHGKRRKSNKYYKKGKYYKTRKSKRTGTSMPYCNQSVATEEHESIGVQQSQSADAMSGCYKKRKKDKSHKRKCKGSSKACKRKTLKKNRSIQAMRSQPSIAGDVLMEPRNQPSMYTSTTTVGENGSRKKCPTCGTDGNGVVNNNTIVLPPGLFGAGGELKMPISNVDFTQMSAGADISQDVLQNKKEISELKKMVERYQELVRESLVKPVVMTAEDASKLPITGRSTTSVFNIQSQIPGTATQSSLKNAKFSPSVMSNQSAPYKSSSKMIRPTHSQLYSQSNLILETGNGVNEVGNGGDGVVSRGVSRTDGSTAVPSPVFLNGVTNGGSRMPSHRSSVAAESSIREEQELKSQSYGIHTQSKMTFFSPNATNQEVNTSQHADLHKSYSKMVRQNHSPLYVGVIPEEEEIRSQYFGPPFKTRSTSYSLSTSQQAADKHERVFGHSNMNFSATNNGGKGSFEKANESHPNGVKVIKNISSNGGPKTGRHASSGNGPGISRTTSFSAAYVSSFVQNGISSSDVPVQTTVGDGVPAESMGTNTTTPEPDKVSGGNGNGIVKNTNFVEAELTCTNSTCHIQCAGEEDSHSESHGDMYSSSESHTQTNFSTPPKSTTSANTVVMPMERRPRKKKRSLLCQWFCKKKKKN